MRKYNFYLENHNAYSITPILQNVVRIRYNGSGVFKQSLMERYELVETNFENVESEMITQDDGYSIKSGNLAIKINKDGSFALRNGERELIDEFIPFHPQEDIGVGGKIRIRDAERFYGGGYRPNRGIELRGQVIKNWCAPVTNNGPSTFVLSSNGWSIFWNNTCETYFDIGCKKSDEFVFWGEDGEFDIFLFAGDFKKMITDFTTVTGKPSLMPLNGYGITIVNGEAETEISLLDKAERLRKEGIPADNFSISCEWMAQYYDKSTKQAWDTSRYFVKQWMREEQTFIGALKHFGIKSTVWTPCEYDLTFEQERRYYKKHPEEMRKPLYDRAIRKDDNSALSIDANSLLFRDDNLYPTIRHDPYTIPEEAWAEHFKKFWDWGIVGIAEDAHAVGITKVDHFYANGYSYKYMHNLNQSLNSLQYHEIYKEHTGKRIFVRTPSTFIGHQRYCGTWCGDTTSNTSLIGLMQYSFQGQSNVTADMISKNPEQIHSGMFMPWVLNFCWGQPVWPWMLTEDMRSIYIDYAKLRYSLMPYVYTEAYRTHITGIPMCTAMIIQYPDDERYYDNFTQYMYGESLLVGALSDTIDLPEGKWIDYWSGQEYEGKTTLKNGYPSNRGGYLFVKKGAIIPFWEDVLYVGQKPIDTMTIRVYPDEKGEYTLYEDDGISFAYEDGFFGLTKFEYEKNEKELVFTVHPTVGQYENMPQHRVYHVEIYMDKPYSMPEQAFYDEEKSAVCFTISDFGSVVIGCQK